MLFMQTQTINLPEDCSKIMERLFVFVDTKDVSLNTRLNLVVNPEIIKILLKQVEHEPSNIKLLLFQQLSSVYSKNPFNSLILAKRDQEIREFNSSILQSLIGFIYSMQVPVGEVADTVKMLVPFVHHYPISCKIVKSILSVLVRDFYEDKINNSVLKMAVNLLTVFMRYQRKEQELPTNFFITYGEDGGLKMMGQKVKWPFAKGFHIYMKFYVDNFTTEEMSLFSISTEHDDFVLMINPQGDIKVKVFAYGPMVRICRVQSQQWITLSLSYTLKSKIFKNNYELQCVVDGTLYEKKELPVPTISMTDQIVEMTLARNLYGRMHAFVISRTEVLLGNKLIMNNWTEIESFLVINKRNIRDLFALYSPVLRTTLNGKEIVYDISSQHHAEMFQNTGIHHDPFGEVDINYYGGLYSYLPFIHLLKFYSYEGYPQALLDIFELYVLLFQQHFSNLEAEAINCQFLSIASQLINELNVRYLTLEVVQLIKRIHLSLTGPQISQEMLTKFIFNINIRKIQQTELIDQLLAIGESYFLQDFEWSYRILNLDQLFHYVIDNLQEQESFLCCFHHYYHHHNNDKAQCEVNSFNNNYLRKTMVLSNILKLVFKRLPTYPSLRPIKTKVMELLFANYSSCLKLLLLQTLKEGVRVYPKFYREEFNLIGHLYLYLDRIQLSEEMSCVFQMLLHCQLEQQSLTLRKGNILRIANTLDRIYSKKCEERRFRGKTGDIRLSNRINGHSLPRRKHSSLDKYEIAAGMPFEKIKRQSRSGQKVEPIETNKELYHTIVRVCFDFDSKEEEWLLKDDEHCLILQPYFRLCCQEYRKNIINMFRNTVVISFQGKPLYIGYHFDKLYKLLLTEFVHRELEPIDIKSNAADLSNDIISNVYFIIDYTVINMKEDWVHLYKYILRLIGIMETAKKDIIQKTHRDHEIVSLAIKLANRKFVIRVIKLAEKNIFNISNMIFLVNMVIFGNTNQAVPGTLFRYFKSIQKQLFVGDSNILNPSNQNSNHKLTFLDSQLILQTVSSFKIHQFDLTTADQNQLVKIINAYFDLQYTKQDSQLFQRRFLYLIRAQFRQLKGTQPLFREVFGKEEEHHCKLISTGEIISTIICLCVQSALNTNNLPLLSESLNNLQQFFLWFLLLSSRDGLKIEDHGDRNMGLPKNIASNVLHFLYAMLHTHYPKQLTNPIEQTLYRVFVFLGLIISSLSKQLGSPDNFEKGLQKAQILKSVEEYNFFSFELLKEVLALKDLKNIPLISKEKVVALMHHPKVSGYFKHKLTLTIDSKIEEISSNHIANMGEIKKQMQKFFSKDKSYDISNRSYASLLNHNGFHKQFVSDHLKKNNLEYRKTKRIWTKIVKRLRLYHYYWAISMNQREQQELPYQKTPISHYRHKFSKFVDSNGVRPVLEVEHVEPWHVKKVLMEKEFQYRNSNYLYHMHQEVQVKKKERSFLQKLMKAQIEAVFYVEWVKHNSKRKGYLSVQQQKLKFKYLSTYQKDSHLDFTSFILAEYKPVEKYWPLVQISDIIERRYLTKRQCLLIQFQDGTSIIFNFPNQDKDDFLRLLQTKQNKPEKLAITKLNKIAFFSKKLIPDSLQTLQQATTMWKSHRMSNFKYLMLVNKYAGRSYLDPANYPVFPWTISNFNQKSYTHRDLSKTVGALGNQERVKFFREKAEACDPFDPVPPYQYGTHYSSPGVVFNFLVRLQPYTEASRTLQGGKFDLSDRLFNSLQVCYNSVTSEVSDVRQLTPEFYYLPQFLLNIDHNDFGVTQQKQRVHNVRLPEWATSAYDFIVKHRQQLESNYVSQNIGNWIDLVFGYKQQGRIAQENLNLFFYLTYEGAIELKDIADEQTRISKEAQIMHFGQTPSQLWSKPHGSRSKVSSYTFALKKISLVFSLESEGTTSILHVKDSSMILFHNYCVYSCHQQNTYQVDRELRILRNNSKENIYFLEDVQFDKRVKIFNQQKFIVIASYVNGDLLVFSLADGTKVEEKKGTPKLCIHVNEREDLLLVGNRSGLLEVYEIVYGEKDSVILMKIASEYYMAPINSISEGGNFFCIASGSLVTLIRASRSLNYVYDKLKMKGVKMIRSLQIPRQVEDCLISIDPLFCFVVFTYLELYCYSGNGQLLATKQADLTFAPVKFTQHFMDYLAYIQNNRLKILGLPFFNEIKDLQLPNKKFVSMKFDGPKCYLVTNFGEIIVLSEESEEDE